MCNLSKSRTHTRSISPGSHFRHSNFDYEPRNTCIRSSVSDEGLRGKSGKAVSVFDWCSPSPLFAFIFILVGISHTSCFRKGGVCIAITSYIDSMFIVHVGLASHMSKVSPDIICLRVLCRCTKNSLFRARRIYKGVN